MAALKSVSRNVTRDQAGSRTGSGSLLDVEDQTALGVEHGELRPQVLYSVTHSVPKQGERVSSTRIVTGDEAQGLDALKWMSSREVVDIVQDEHPQIIAIVLSHFSKAAQAAEVIEKLPEEHALRHRHACRKTDRHPAERAGGNREPDREQIVGCESSRGVTRKRRR